MSDYAIELKGLRKDFGEKAALDGLDLIVPGGSIFGFLGVNGAGKTTTIRAVMGHLHPTGGEVRTLGVDPWAHGEDMRRRVAYVSENMNLPGWMTPEYAVRFSAGIYPAWNVKLADRLLVDFDLRGTRPFGHLSKGQKRRTCILLALCQNADLIVMDEPASGLDVEARRGFLERILEIACDEGRTFFISSHILSDLERVVDRIGIIHEGRLRLQGELEDLKTRVRKLRLPGDVSRETLEKYFKVVRHERGTGETICTVRDFDEERMAMMSAEPGWPGSIRDFGLNLEDLFIEVTKSGSSEDVSRKERML